MEKRQAYTILVCALIIVCGIAYVIFSGASLTTVPGPQTVQERTPPPPPSQEVLDMLAKSKGFAALVSYTDNGFEPAAVTIHAGEAVRFINNSSGELLWVASTSTTAAYPGTSECGGSSFDTCKALKKGEFWEFTFDEAGTWHYRNNSDTTKTGTVLVR